MTTQLALESNFTFDNDDPLFLHPLWFLMPTSKLYNRESPWMLSKRFPTDVLTVKAVTKKEGRFRPLSTETTLMALEAA